MTETDLLGDAVRQLPPSNGYAAPPGTGPAGETCRTCRHYTRKRMSKVYRKCGLMAQHWTNGYGTDIKASAPACRRWEAA